MQIMHIQRPQCNFVSVTASDFHFFLWHTNSCLFLTEKVKEI